MLCARVGATESPDEDPLGDPADVLAYCGPIVYAGDDNYLRGVFRWNMNVVLVLALDGDPVQAVFGSSTVEPEDIRRTDGYKLIHNAAADPYIDMAVEIVPRSALRRTLTGEALLKQPAAHVIVVILNRPYSTSSDAGIHLEHGEVRNTSHQPSPGG